MANAAAMLLAGRPEAIALIEDEQRLDYAGLRQRVVHMAAVWRSLSLTPGDKAVIALLDGIDSVTALLGLIWMGGVPALVSPRTDVALVPELLVESQAKLMLTEDGLAQALNDARIMNRSAWLSRVKNTELIDSAAFEAAPDDPAFLLFSSGTTGKPKGIAHAHRCAEHAHVFAREILGATSADRFISTSKLFFAYPLANSLLAGLRLGASVVLDPQWPSPERLAILTRQHTPTILFSVPTLYQRLLESDLRFDSITRYVSAGEACPPALANAWERKHGVGLVNGYGTTETLALVLYRLSAMAGFRPTPLTHAREESSDPGDPEASLRLWFSHPSLSLGYTRVVTHDSAVFCDNEFSPGDVFRRAATDQDQGWIFAGRSDQLLKVYGRWVDTVALEHWFFERLQEHVRELSIVPYDSDGGPISLHMFLAPLSGKGESLAARLETVSAELPAFKKPAATHVLPELPRTETGKVRRGALRAMC